MTLGNSSMDQTAINKNFSEKARVPSWTDRVLIKSEFADVLTYQRYELDFSDHKPVGMLCRVRIS